jgi:hypothetical protein
MRFHLRPLGVGPKNGYRFLEKSDA